MLNLLRTDLYRVFRSKSFYICFGILVFINIVTFGILFIITNPSTRDLILQFGAELSADASDIESSLANTTILEIFRQRRLSFRYDRGFWCTLYMHGFRERVY